MKRFAVIVILSFGFFSSHAQKGKPFPLLSAKTLDGKDISFPENIKGKNSIVCIIYSPKTEKALETWIQPLVNTFLATNPLDPEPYDVNMYFVVLLSGIKDLASDAIEKKFKKNVDKGFYKNIVIYQGSTKTYLTELDFGKKDEPYFAVINKDGIISYSTTGAYTNDKLTEIENKISE